MVVAFHALQVQKTGATHFVQFSSCTHAADPIPLAASTNNANASYRVRFCPLTELVYVWTFDPDNARRETQAGHTKREAQARDPMDCPRLRFGLV